MKKFQLHCGDLWMRDGRFAGSEFNPIDTFSSLDEAIAALDKYRQTQSERTAFELKALPAIELHDPVYSHISGATSREVKGHYCEILEY